MAKVVLPTPSEFNRGCLEYEKNEQRDSMYKVATFLMKHFWGSPADMADSLGVLLATWNNAFYRYGLFSYDLLQACIEKNISIMERFRSMKIIEYNQEHNSLIQELFESLLTALKISYGKNSERKSPVSAAKALHLLAPEFFPIWDDKISKAYDCFYSKNTSEKYIKFINISMKMAVDLLPYAHRTDRSILKLIDEYNYAKYTKKWI